MKNKTFLKISALIMVIFMSLSLFAVYASATEKVIYDEGNSSLTYDDRTITLTVDAEKLGKVLKDAKFNKKALEELLPYGIYRIIDERSKASVIDFLVNLAQKEVLTYDELLNAFSGNEEVMKRYINFDFVAPYVKSSVESTKDVMKQLYAEGKLDAILAAPGFKDALTEKAGTKDIPEAVSHYTEFCELIHDMELGDLFPMRDLWEEIDVPTVIANASGSQVNKTLRSFVNQVITGEIDEAYVNGLQVFFTTETGKELDHNALQTALLQGLPSVADLATIGDGDTFVEYLIETKGLENESGEARIDMEFTFKVVLKGDASKINKNANRANGFIEYLVQDDGLIVVDMYADERFVENYNKVLECEGISKDRILEYLGLYTADAAALREQITGAKFDEFLDDAKAASVAGSGKIDSRSAFIEKVRKLMLKFSDYETQFTCLDDAYLGYGVFAIRLTDVIPMDDITDKIESRFSSIDELMKWISQDDHIIDILFNLTIDDFYRVRYFDEDGELLYLTYIPVGTDLSFFDDVEALQGKAPYGWVDIIGATYTEMPDEDLDLYAAAPTQDVEVVKIWDDNDDEAGARPETITITLKLNGEVAGIFDLSADSIAINEEYANELFEKLQAALGDTIEFTDEMKQEMLQSIPLPEKDEEEDDENVWSVTFPNLPMYIDGEPAEIEIEEAPVEGYASSIVVDDGVFVITNTYKEVQDLTIVKIWNDDSNRDGQRPASIKVTLLADGEPVADTVVYGVPVEVTDGTVGSIEENAQLASVSEDGNTWEFVFGGVPVLGDDGQQINYTVVEDEVEGYATTYNELTITNTYSPEMVTVSGAKVWDDEDNRRNKRPESVTIILLANGEEVARQDVTGEGNTWNFEFVRLAKYENGEEIEYTVDEVEVVKYAKAINGTTITNTYVKSPDTGAAEISLFVILGVLALAGSTAAVITFRKRRDQE